MKTSLIDRIFKSWKSTLIGLLIILGALVAVFFDKATLTEASIFIGAGIGAFFLNDSKSPPEAGAGV